MTESRRKLVREAQGLLASCGYRLVSVGEDLYQVVQQKTGEILGQWTLFICGCVAVVLAGSDRKPETATGPAAYQAGVAMSRRLK